MSDNARMKKAWVWWGLPALLLLALLWGFLAPARRMQIGTVTRAPFVESFEEEGRTRLIERWVIASPVAGTVARIELEPGDPVRFGQVLARLAPSSAALLDPGRQAQAEAELRAATAQTDAAAARVREAEAARELAQSNRDRAREVRASGAIAQADLDRAEAQARQAQAAARAVRSELLAARQRQTAASAQLAHQGVGGGVEISLSAPIDGVVIRRHVESSLPVVAGQPLLELGDPRRIEIEVEALSTDAVRLRPGMRAQVLRWGGAQPLAATVTRIEPGGFTKVSALGVEEQRTRVIAALDGDPAQWATLGDAYRVEVAFELRRDERALVLPASAVFRDPTCDGEQNECAEAWAVYVVAEGRARLRPVRASGFASRAVAIADGVDEGERIVLYPDDQLRDGQRVRAAE